MGKPGEYILAIGATIDRSRHEILRGDFLGSVSEGLVPETGKNRWRPTRILRNLATNTAGGITFSRSWPKIGRDHSRSRYGNPRP